MNACLSNRSGHDLNTSRQFVIANFQSINVSPWMSWRLDKDHVATTTHVEEIGKRPVAANISSDIYITSR